MKNENFPIFSNLKKLDFLGRDFSFEYEDSTYYRTYEGALLSFLTFIAALVIIIMFGREVYERKNPNVSFSEEFIDNSIVKMKDFPIMFSFHYSDSSEVPNINDFLDLTVHLHGIYDNATQYVFYNHTLVPCATQLNLYEENKELVAGTLAYSYIKNYYCVDFTNLTHSRNDFPEFPSAEVKINFLLCNKTLREDCKYDSATAFGLDTLIISTHYLESVVDASNFTQPIQKVIKTYFQTVSEGILKILKLKVVNNLLSSDNGWMLEEIRNEIFETVKFENDVNLYREDQSSNYVYVILLNSTKLRNIIKRNYLKIQELFARVGGIANAFFIVIKVVSYNYIRFKYLLFIRENSILLTHKEEHEKRKKKQSISSMREINFNAKLLESEKARKSRLSVLSPYKSYRNLGININSPPHYELEQKNEIEENDNAIFSTARNHINQLTSEKIEGEKKLPNLRKNRNEVGLQDMEKVESIKEKENENEVEVEKNPSNSNLNSFTESNKSENSSQKEHSIKLSQIKLDQPNKKLKIIEKKKSTKNLMRFKINKTSNIEALKNNTVTIHKNTNSNIIKLQLINDLSSNFPYEINEKVKEIELKTKLDYFKYLKLNFCFCCMKKKDHREIYAKEIRKVKEFLNIKTFAKFLMENYYSILEQNEEMNDV